ncbi:MAG TPA: amidohydrolase family protein [archaeon]|nr:amidohydrolase family protein [archaeon]
MSALKHLVLTGCRLVTRDRVYEGSVEIKDGRIVRVGRFSHDEAPGAQVIELHSAYLLPGLIDMHINDGVALLRGLSTPEEHADRLAEVSAGLISYGITGVFMATLAAPLQEIRAYLEGMALFQDRWASQRLGTELCGAMLEGTFLNPDNCGAHNPANVFRPERKILDSLTENGVVRIVNIAPEYGDESLDLISYAVEQGLVAAAGHCKPTAEQLIRAVDRGLSYFIHLLNGPTGTNTKAFYGGGTLEGALREDRLTVELIVDFIHVQRPALRDIIARKEYSRLVAVSDIMFPTDAPEGEFEIGGIIGRMSKEKNYLTVVGQRDPEGRVVKIAPPKIQSCDFSTLYGSVIKMDRVFANMIELLTSDMEGNFVRRHQALPFEEAVRQAAIMCSTNPARVTGRLDGSWGRKVGALEEGFEADLVAAEIEKTPSGVKFRPKEVFLAGRPMLDR